MSPSGSTVPTQISRSHATVLTFALAMALACGFARSGWGESGALPPTVKPLEAPGIHNFFAIGTQVFSGSTPEDDASFAALAKLGIRTIITVDGAKPDVDAARRHGIRYVHLPHGYDGISTNRQVQLIKAAQTLPGPFYVHCHHGRHRGPTAAAILCLASDGWTPAAAEAWLKAAGTSTNYAGLYEAVRRFQRPPADVLNTASTDFPEVAQVSGIVDAMVEIDEHWSHLKAVQAAGYKAPPGHPDLQPANEAVILWEHYREAQRIPDSAQLGNAFLEQLRTAEANAKVAEGLLRLATDGGDPALRTRLDAAFETMARDCSTCHKAHRDRADPSRQP